MATSAMSRNGVRTSGFSAIGSDFLLKAADGQDLFIAGYASVDMVDKQGDRIPSSALTKAFEKFMDNKAFRNVQLAHSGIQVGEVVSDYTDSEGRIWKSEVDEHGLFVVCRIRDDIQKAREVQKQVRNGELRAFSIGGQALFRVSKTTPEHGSHREITDLELHEITLCKKGINPEARYTILKMDNETGSSNMSNEALEEIRDGLSRVLKHIDENDVAKAEDKGMPKSYKEEKGMPKEDEEDPTEAKKSQEDALAYIDTLEKFAHESGVDLDGLRSHFGLEKAYLQEGSGGYSHRGQGDEVGSGEDASEPTYPALPAASGNSYVIKQPGSMQMNAAAGNQNVIKGGLNLTPSSLERGYRAYANIRDEEAVKSLVQKEWAERYDTETANALALQKENDYGGQIAQLRKQIESLSLENSDLQKSATPTPSTTSVRVPTHDEFNAMGNGLDGWKMAEDLGRRALRGE
jgi:HK97 family phage prohead protease